MTKQFIDYSKTIIYKIVCNDLNITEVYVGHTTNFINRKAKHKSNCNNIDGKAYNYKIYNTIRNNGGFENWSMIEIEKFQDCNDINEASARERYWYELLNAKLNTNCPARNKKEYYKDNKDNFQKVNKEYREINKDKIQKVNKEYYKNNKDKINEIKKTHYICDICNGTYTHTHRAQHFKSIKHQTALNNND
jgi:hypothetical protein